MDPKNTAQNSDLHEELKRTRRELSVVSEISNAMRTTLELEHILYIILTGVTSHTGLGFNRAILFLLNPKERRLEPRLAIGPDSAEDAQKIWDYIDQSNQDLDDLIKEDRIAQAKKPTPLFQHVKDLKISLDIKNQNLCSKVFHEGAALHIRPKDMLMYQDDPLVHRLGSEELVIVPLKAKDKINGLIVADNLYNQKPITDEDLQIFTMLANQAGLAIENSQLYEMVKEQSHKDALTGLWNHGFFQHTLSSELESAKKHKQPLSLIILDIDDFKKLNDTYGHQTGDLILKDIAQILKDSSREIDYVCRYGGEEFSIILTQTDKDQGYSIAERIREKIEQYRCRSSLAPKALQTTVSLGLATYPENAQSKEELITQADKAMYISKFSGKNQTSLPNGL